MTAATVLTPEKRQEFLRLLAKHGCVTAAARAIGASRQGLYRIRGQEGNEDFAAAWDDAIQQATDLLILELRRRAYRGTNKPVFYQGVECGKVREYSDTLGMFLVKGVRPEYATERKQLTGADGAPLIPAVPALTDKERAIITTVATQLLLAECDDATTD